MTFAIVLIGWIFSLCLHEFGHAIVAYYGGDTTVKDKGYLTFNPLRYTDPLMSIVLPLLFLAMGGIGLPGGAVYIERWRLKNNTWQSLVSLAGPIANLVVLIVLSLILNHAPMDNDSASNSVWPGLAFLALVQASAIVLNLIPLPPFDGYGILEPFLHPDLRDRVNSVRMFIMAVVFISLWRIPMVNDLLWSQVFSISYRLGIPLDLAFIGLERFMFWKL
ncbi:MAG: putative zinc metalloprotease Rip2 [Anaerolineales bacterium]|nr:putative zinc metalloprotease Rip2 [Anaerolineales bacterium]